MRKELKIFEIKKIIIKMLLLQIKKRMLNWIKKIYILSQIKTRWSSSTNKKPKNCKIKLILDYNHTWI